MLFQVYDQARCDRAPRFRLEDGGLGEHVFRELLAAGGGEAGGGGGNRELVCRWKEARCSLGGRRRVFHGNSVGGQRRRSDGIL